MRMLEASILPAARPDRHTRPEEQVSHRLADARLERRERARELATRRGDDR